MNRIGFRSHLEEIEGQLQGLREVLGSEEGTTHSEPDASVVASMERRQATLLEEEGAILWVLDAIEQFDQRWEVFTPENRRRLVQSLVEEVRVDEAAGNVTVRLASVGMAS